MFKAKINGVELTEEQLRNGLAQIEEQKRVPILKAGDALQSTLNKYYSGYIVLPQISEIAAAVKRAERAGGYTHLAMHIPSGSLYTCDFVAGSALPSPYKIVGNIADCLK